MALIQRVLRRYLGENNVVVRVESPAAVPSVEGQVPNELYASQANVQAVVSFLADSVSQLPLKVYIRDGESSRRRDRTSDAARTLWRPNANQTEYEFINALMIEYFLNGAAAVWHLPDPDYESGHQLRVIPRAWITDSDFDTAYSISSITVKSVGNAPAVKIPATDFTFFKYYRPGQPGGFISPVSSLKQILSEQIQADRFRSRIWRSSGRFNAYISRPKDVAAWDEETRKKWIQAFREGWGSGGSNEGKIPLLEDGMEIKPYQFNAKEAQYAETKQLSREDVAAAYHVNPSLIWHTNTQTFASAKDNARALYSDCLGPTLQMLQQRINTFLLPMLGAVPNTYVEFDLTEKLKGSFEERAAILQSAVGGPYMTRNEARADSNLPPVDGGDQLIVPLNVNNGIDNPAVGEEAPKMRYISKKSAESTHIKGKADELSMPAVTGQGAVVNATQASVWFERALEACCPDEGDYAGLEVDEQVNEYAAVQVYHTIACFHTAFSQASREGRDVTVRSQAFWDALRQAICADGDARPLVEEAESIVQLRLYQVAFESIASPTYLSGFLRAGVGEQDVMSMLETIKGATDTLGSFVATNPSASEAIYREIEDGFDAAKQNVQRIYNGPVAKQLAGARGGR